MKKLAITKMCTSVAIGFYLRGFEDFLEFKHKILAFNKLDNSIFSVYEIKPIQLKNEQIDEMLLESDK